MTTDRGGFEAVIGLEVHAQLQTRTKAFCGCETSFGAPPNTHVCPVCLGLPGAMPALNAEAVRMAIAAGLALGCTIQPRSVFARKNYFYPDLPKGYQISQYELPLAKTGALAIEVDGVARVARIHRVHMEEDAGKSVHAAGGASSVDLNRAGTPLFEIVGEPDLRSGAEAAEYLRRLREILMFIGVNDGNLEQGSFRCDANVSVRPVGQERLGTRTELKNINSFRFVADAIELEIDRQIELVRGGGAVRQQTRGYNADRRETYVLRDKGGDADYRYFPEPDLPPLVVRPEAVEAVRAALPRLPAEHRRVWVEELGLPAATAAVLSSHPGLAAYFERVRGLGADGTRAANFIQGELLRDAKLSGLDAELPLSPEQLAELLALVDKGTISGKQAKELYMAIAGTAASPSAVATERGMVVLRDEGKLEAVARAVLAANAKQVAAYRGGKTALFGYFVGQLMRETRGSAAPELANALLRRLLDAPEEPGA